MSTPAIFYLSKELQSMIRTVKYEMNALKSSIYFKPFLAWVIWIYFGTVFYSYQDQNGWSKGFYMAVNVGYNIGWGYPNETNDDARVFSIFYLLIGSSAIATSLAFFAKSMIVSSKDWYTKALEREKYKSSTYIEYIQIWILANQNSVKAILMWLLWILSLTIFALAEIKWDFIQSLYFAVSSLSTGGLYPIPKDSPDWYYLYVGIFTCTGVPITCIAMGSIASMLIFVGDPDEAQKAIQQKVTTDELKMMQKYNIDDGDGTISRAEYILLCAVRLGAVSEELVEKIHERFSELDIDNDGELSYQEVLESPNMKLAANKLSSILSTDYSPMLQQQHQHHQVNSSSDSSSDSYLNNNNEDDSLRINTDDI